MRLTELIKKAGLPSIKPERDFSVYGVTADSRQVKKDFIFVAIKGNLEDGNKFKGQALKKGAGIVVSQADFPKEDMRLVSARLAAEFYLRPAEKIRITGITGTNGKTTVSYLIEKILKEAGKNPAVIGTINYRFNNKVLPSNNTTPGPVDLQKMFARMVKAKVTHCVMEVSSHALDQGRIQGIGFSQAVFTNLASDHLDYHKTSENYFQAKAKLFRKLDKKASAIINNDDKRAPYLMRICPAKIFTYGIDKPSSVRAEEIRYSPHSTEFILKVPGKSTEIKTQLIGRHNVYNVLSAVAWALSEGLSLSCIKRAVEGFSFVPGRLEKIKCKDGFSVFVDYAHTEDALCNVLVSLRKVSSGGRIILVFGCGGDRDKTKRPKMGRVATEMADFAFITSDNPRSEKPASIAADIIKGVRKNNYSVILKRERAIQASISSAREGDIVLIAGKGHENYQITGNKRIHFDDRQIARLCLR